jgi:cell division control protein 6
LRSHKYLESSSCNWLILSGSAYQEVRQALQGYEPTNLPGREEHLDKLHSFLQNHLSAGTSGTLYVSGPPGTGKTACLSKVMELPEVKYKNYML